MGRIGQKIVWDSEISTNFCCKIMVHPKKIRFLLEIRLKFFTFGPKSECSLKKKIFLSEIRLGFLCFRPKIIVFLKKKKNSLEIRRRFLTFFYFLISYLFFTYLFLLTYITYYSYLYSYLLLTYLLTHSSLFSNKKGFHLGLALRFSNFVPNQWCSLLS